MKDKESLHFDLLLHKFYVSTLILILERAFCAILNHKILDEQFSNRHETVARGVVFWTGLPRVGGYQAHTCSSIYTSPVSLHAILRQFHQLGVMICLKVHMHIKFLECYSCEGKHTRKNINTYFYNYPTL